MKRLFLILAAFLVAVPAFSQLGYEYKLNKRTGRFDLVVDTSMLYTILVNKADSTLIRAIASRTAHDTLSEALENGIEVIPRTEYETFKDSINAIVTALRNAAEQHGDVDFTAPVFASASVITNVVKIVMDTTDVDQSSVPPTTAWSIDNNGSAIAVTNVTLDKDTVQLTLASNVTYNVPVTFDYTKGTPALRDSALNETANTTDFVITNNAPPPIVSRVQNGAFATSDYWTATGACSITGGVMSFSDVSVGSISQTQANMVNGGMLANTAFTVNFDIAISGANTARISFYNGAGSITYIAAGDYANGHHSVNFTTGANIAGGGLYLEVSGSGTTAAFTLDNLTIVTQ